MFARYEQEMEDWLGSPPEVDPVDLVSELDVVLARINRDEARAAELLGRIVETDAYKRDGYSSPTAMLKHRYSWQGNVASQMVARANGLKQTLRVAASYELGEISSAQVDALLQARATAPEPFAAEETGLVETALGTPLVGDLRRTLDYWLKEVAADEQDNQRSIVRDCRSLRVRRDRDMIHFSAYYDIETGEQLLAALEPGLPAADDDRSTPMRRADQLLDIINGAQNRPNLVVHVSYQELLAAKGKTDAKGKTEETTNLPGLSETRNQNFLSRTEIDRISCDAAICRVVFGPGNRPIEVGRAKRLVTPAQRIALEARDRGCVFVGCDRPANWCDVHHLDAWLAGGMTDLDNLVLLCRHHHNLIHDREWTITGEPGNLTFHRPNGTLLEEQPPTPDQVVPSGRGNDPYKTAAAFQAIKDEYRHLGRDGPD